MTGVKLTEFLTAHPAQGTDAVVFWPDGSRSLDELTAEAMALADLLRNKGLQPGQLVGHVVESGVESLSVLFGVWLAEGVYMPLNDRLTDSEIASQLNDTPAIALVAREGEGREAVATWSPLGESWSWGAVAPKGEAEPLPADTALIMRTSGTTGSSKPVVLAHDGVAKGIDSVLANMGAKRAGKRTMPNLIPTSLALWSGVWNVLFGFRAGSPVILMDRFDTLAFAGFVREHQLRSTVLAPAMMAMLTEDPEVTDLAPLTTVRNITAPLTPVQARAFATKFGIGIMNCYGQTELGGEVVGWSAADLRAHGDTKLGAVGRPHLGVDVHILDGNHQLLPQGSIGAVWVRSKSMSTDPEVVEQLVDGFLRTGDLGRLDEEGFLWLEGRAGDVINRGGLKIMPQEVEEALRELPEIADAAVAAVPDVRLGEVPWAWVRLTGGFEGELSDLVPRLRGRLTGYKLPVGIEAVEDLPRNEIGKVTRRVLVEQWTATRAAPEAANL